MAHRALHGSAAVNDARTRCMSRNCEFERTASSDGNLVISSAQRRSNKSKGEFVHADHVICMNSSGWVCRGKNARNRTLPSGGRWRSALRWTLSLLRDFTDRLCMHVQKLTAERWCTAIVYHERPFEAPNFRRDILFGLLAFRCAAHAKQIEDLEAEKSRNLFLSYFLKKKKCNK